MLLVQTDFTIAHQMHSSGRWRDCHWFEAWHLRALVHFRANGSVDPVVTLPYRKLGYSSAWPANFGSDNNFCQPSDFDVFVGSPLIDLQWTFFGDATRRGLAGRVGLSSKDLAEISLRSESLVIEGHTVYFRLANSVIDCVRPGEVAHDLKIRCHFTLLTGLSWTKQTCAFFQGGSGSIFHEEMENIHCSVLVHSFHAACHLKSR